MTRVLIVDDHDVVRKGLRQMLSETAGMIVAGEAANGHEALAIVVKDDFEVAILDLGMPGRGGLEVLKELKTRKPFLKVIVLSIYPEDPYGLYCLREGAYGYLSKAGSLTELVQAVRVVATGKKYITPTLAQKIATSIYKNGSRVAHERLSRRELQILALIGSGKTLSQISQELSLSAKTISTYRSRILLKIGLNTTPQLIRYALQNGLAT